MNKTKSKAAKDFLSENGRKYDCKECGKLMSNMGQCEYQANEKGNIKRHRRSVHEGKTYSCRQCEYHATVKGSLERHRRSVHEGPSFSIG